MPGLEQRLPLMFDAMVSQGRLGAETFVELTATAPADIFGLTGKGRIEVGADADIAIWNPAQKVAYTANDLHDAIGYNPFAGRTVTGWPETVLSRGVVVLSKGRSFGAAGRGKRIVMTQSAAMQPMPNAAADVIDHPI